MLLHENGELLREIEAILILNVIKYILTNASGPPHIFDSCLLDRGFRVIKCDTLASKYFLMLFNAKINTTWKGLKLILATEGEIPWRPRARIWLPKSSGMYTYKLQNTLATMDD